MRLHHAALIVDDLEAAARFYEEVLGLKRDERPAHDFPGIYYRLAGGAQLHLMELPDPCGLHARPDHPGRDRHIALSVENLAPVRARLEAAGIAWTASRSGRAAVFVRDPAGNAIELVEEG
ncbi:MAG: glyoxalase [Planctomycetota bacterium]|nr:MAG: glyoxalase [Planctomycetota bacterium]